MRFGDIVNNLIIVLDRVVVLIIALALVYFLYGVVRYIGRHGDEKARSEGIMIMTHGIIALFVMVSVWGLVNLLVDFLPTSRLGIPQF